MRIKITKSIAALFAVVFLLFLVSMISTVKASVKSYQKNADGVTFTLDKGLMKIFVRSSDIIEVKYTMLDGFQSKESLVVNNKWTDKTNFTVAEAGQNIIINTASLKLSISKTTNAIIYMDKKGMVITAEDAQNKTMKPATIAGISTYNCSTQFTSPKNEALYGLGCHPEDSLSINYKGRNQEMLIKYMTGAIPVLLSTNGYGLLWDNYAASNFYGAEAGNTKFKYTSESGKEVDYYFFYGPDFDKIINLYRTATGRAPMFPKWAFGLFQSQDRYKTQDEIIGVKDNYRNNHIPVDAIVQDWYWWEPLPIGSHIMNPARYPNPKKLVDELHQANMHAMISIWPLYGSGTKNYDAMKKNGFLTSITWDNFVSKTFDTYYDAHNPKARKLYWEQARDSIVKRYGWDAWWVDQCEPDNGTLLDERRQANFSVGKGIDYFNTYSLEHSKGLYEGWRKDIPKKRAVLLIRQSFAGEQRNAAILWSSDITTTFASFKNQVPQGINACVSGIPYWTSDIGGYLSRTSADGIPDWSQPEKRELFTRWFQFGTFSPIMRIHGKGERAMFSNNWDANTKAILLKYDKLRYRLLPYIYSLAGRVTNENYTIMRNLNFDFRNDPQVRNIPDQYMFGPAFLVNPVTEQLYTGKNSTSGKSTRSVYLPTQTQWYDFYTGKMYNGGQTINAAAPIETMPLYVKAGSIVPMGPEMEYATEKPADKIELRIYTGADGRFLYYEDENDNYNYEKGNSAAFTLNWNDKSSTLTISDTKGNFPDMLKKHVFNVVLIKKDKAVGEQMAQKADRTITYLGKAISVKM
ncbi:MAG: TIM-barrel domain-containing protein [Janthinobacterium lividum]